MSISVTKSEGVTILTMTSDPSNACPPLCQILCGLCYSPRLCSLSHHLRSLQQDGRQYTLGALQIMTGLFNIGLGTSLIIARGSYYMLYDNLFPIWLGILFMFFGILSILSQRFPSPCLVLLSGIVNVIGSLFAITGIVMFSINLTYGRFWGMCNEYQHDYYYSWNTPAPTTPFPDKKAILERCNEGKALLKLFFLSITAVLIVLSFLEFCVVISSATFSFKALTSKEKKAGFKPLEVNN